MSVLTLETNRYAINIENFQGPLDLLLSLIEKNKMDIYDIKLDEITDQYLEYINKAQELNLDLASEFLSLASTLLYIKSRKLLPGKNEEEEEISEEELIRRIIEYKKYKDITEKLRQSFEENSKRFYKGQEEITLPKQKLEEKYEENIIPTLYENLWIKNKEKVNENAKNIEKIAITETVTVLSKVKQMYKELIKHKQFIFNKLFSIKKANSQEVVTAFSGLLELSRREKVETEQRELFGDINVKRKWVWKTITILTVLKFCLKMLTYTKYAPLFAQIFALPKFNSFPNLGC